MTALQETQARNTAAPALDYDAIIIGAGMPVPALSFA